LIGSDPGKNKVDKAKELNVQIIDEEYYLNLIQLHQSNKSTNEVND